MKKCVALGLTVLMLLSLPLCIAACSKKEKLPADFVKGDEVVVDNETPFVYDETSVRYYTTTEDGKEYKFDVEDYVYRLGEDSVRTHAQMTSIFGNKILRHFTEGDKDIYYSVYSLPDNKLFYLFFHIKDGVYYVDMDYHAYMFQIYDARDDGFEGLLYEQDFPAVILGDRLPAECYLENHTPQEIERRNNLEWEFYGEHCDRAGLTTDPFISDYYCELYEQGRHKELDGAIRCIQSVSFDTITKGETEADDVVYHGTYVYDIYVHTDGTGVLHFYHFNADSYPRYTAWQTEVITLSPAETATLKSLLDEWDFVNIPTWNPEERSGFDGETTTVYVEGLGHSNLTSMWSASERDAVYHIREAIEEIVRDRVTVKRGRIYNEKELEDIFPKPTAPTS